MKKTVLLGACALLATSAVCADVALDGVWQVTGEGFAAEAKLPGTLAAAHLGQRWTEHDFETTMDLEQSEALVQEWKYDPLLLSPDGRTVDPLSLFLSLRNETDPRVRSALEECLEAMQW